MSPASVLLVPVPGIAASQMIESPSTITTGAVPVPRTATGPIAEPAVALAAEDQFFA